MKAESMIESLPSIPGGWRVEQIELGCLSSHSSQSDVSVVCLIVPADPDAFLDDADVVARNVESDYMPYWAHLWPTARLMARFVFQRKWATKEAIELGCGVGLVGLAGLMNGLKITFSDYDPVALEVARRSAEFNGQGENARQLLLDWRSIPCDLARCKTVFACDVTYEESTHEVLLDVLDALLAASGECWIGDPGRQHLPDFCSKALRRGYHVDAFDFDEQSLNNADGMLPEFEIGTSVLLRLARVLPTDREIAFC